MVTADALEGMQVVELATGVAGPIVGMLMADLGAEVVKVEPPSGDPDRGSASFTTFNRGKLSVIIDPATDRERLEQLLHGADLVIVGAGAWQAHGIQRDAILAACPRLVVLDLPSYAASAPGWHGGGESSGLLAAAGAIAWRQSSHDGGPVEALYPHVLYVHGLWATACGLAALFEREESGAGQLVTVTGANAVMVTHVNALTIPSESPDPNTAVGSSGRHPTYTRYQAGDGLWFGCGALGRKFEVALLNAIGLADVLNDPRIDGRTERILLPDNFDWVRQRIGDVFMTQPRDHWIELITRLGIPCGPFGDPEEWMDHPQVDAIGMRVEVSDPERGVTVLPGYPVQMAATPAYVRGPAPAVGQHNDDVAPRPAVAAPDRPRLGAGPLSGVRVLNSGTFVAGPFSGMLLSELGASVVKVEPTGGDPFRQSGFTFNRGMRSAVVDLTQPAGLDAFLSLAAVSDVVVDSLRPGVTTKLGIDHAALCAVNSDVISVSLSGYGERGPLAQLPGVDMVLQGMAGLMSAQGGDDEPVTNTIAIVDVTAAVLIALGSVTALLVRRRTGIGQRVTTSLAAAVTFIQSAELTRYDGRPPAIRGARDLRGFGTWDRYYGVRDGWVRVQAVTPPDVQRLEMVGLAVDRSRYEADPQAAVQAMLRDRTAQDVVAALADVDVPAVAARRVSEVLRDPVLRGEEFVHVQPSDDGGFFCAPGRHATFGRTQRFGPMRVAGAGEHTVELLSEAGLSEHDVSALVAAGAVVVGTPTPQQLAASYR